MRDKIKNNIKLIMMFLLGMMVSATGVFAVTTIIKSSDVTYDNTSSGGSSKNVQGSIDELYQKAKTLSGDLGKKYTEEILHGADPVLGTDMIPVTIDDNGTVKYANINSKWYSYERKKWANAVILNSSSKKYEVGDTISETDIESYFVWIPRYKYKIWNLGNYTNVKTVTGLSDDGEANDGEGGNNLSVRKLFGNARTIEVVFESKDTNPTKDEKIGGYLTHPAFQLGEKKLNGIWVGKFETSNSSGVKVKPNVQSWRSQNVSTFFNTSYTYKRNLESHMMKNTEWGAVAYLSHSAYGKGSEININNNSSYLTGYSAAPNTDQSTYPGTYGNNNLAITEPYNTATGYLASTTGNITGVYDMSGGAHEYMASYRKDTPGSSGFTQEQINGYVKGGYIDEYDSTSSVTSYNKRILGDATGEMGPFFNYKDSDKNNRYHNTWYADNSYFVDASYPWFNRGGVYDNGVLAGQFAFYRYTGEANSYVASRLVLAVG